MFLNAEGSRTLSLSDMYDDSCSSSSWLNRHHTVAATAAARHSESLCALLSLSASTSEAGTLGDPGLEQYALYAVGRRSLQQDSGPGQQPNHSNAATCAGSPLSDSRHSSCAGFRRRSSQVTYTALHAARKSPRSNHSSAVGANHQEQRSPRGPPNGWPSPRGAACISPAHEQHHHQQTQQHSPYKARHSAPAAGQQRTSPRAAVPLLQLRLPGPLATTREGHAPAADAAPAVDTAGGAAAVSAAGRASDPAAAAAGSRPGLPSKKELTERKLVKCLKKLQQDKQRWVQ